MKTKLTNDAKLLLATSSLSTISDVFIGAFFISFIMRNSIHEIISVSLYRLFLFIALTAGFFILSNFVKRKDKVALFRLHLIPKIATMLAIIFLREAVVDYIIPMGLLIGAMAAMYWAPMHSMVSEKVSNAAMTKYIGYDNMLAGMTKVATPIILGLLITSTSYEDMAKFGVVVCLIEFAFSFFLKPSMHRSKNRPDFAGFFNCMMRFSVIRKLFSIEVLRGFSTNGALGTIITMYTVYIFKTDFNLGILTTIFSGIAITTSFLFGRFVKKSIFPQILFTSTLAAMSSLVLFISHTSEWTFIIYNFVAVTGLGLLGKIANSNMYYLSKSPCVSREHKTEYFVFRESALGIGRLLSFSGMLAVGIFGGYEFLRWYLVPITLAVVLMGYWSIGISRHIK
jgi:hypothetical protein